jgi:DeoR/GlpR family transcriptional regulator of sugar metabolism
LAGKHKPNALGSIDGIELDEGITTFNRTESTLYRKMIEATQTLALLGITASFTPAGYNLISRNCSEK